jgi:hypothetical protein
MTQLEYDIAREKLHALPKSTQALESLATALTRIADSLERMEEQQTTALRTLIQVANQVVPTRP